MIKAKEVKIVKKKLKGAIVCVFSLKTRLIFQQNPGYKLTQREMLYKCFIENTSRKYKVEICCQKFEYNCHTQYIFIPLHHMTYFVILQQCLILGLICKVIQI